MIFIELSKDIPDCVIYNIKYKQLITNFYNNDNGMSRSRFLTSISSKPNIHLPQ
jgi:hypothetical protein